MVKILDGLLYSDTHEWVKIEGDFAYIGITDYAQSHLGAVVFVDLPKVGQSFKQRNEFGAVESVKAAADLIIPLSGEVVQINDDLEVSPELLNSDCYGNFIIKIKLDDLEEIKSLLSAEQYRVIANR